MNVSIGQVLENNFAEKWFCIIISNGSFIDVVRSESGEALITDAIDQPTDRMDELASQSTVPMNFLQVCTGSFGGISNLWRKEFRMNGMPCGEMYGTLLESYCPWITHSAVMRFVKDQPMWIGEKPTQDATSFSNVQLVTP